MSVLVPKDRICGDCNLRKPDNRLNAHHILYRTENPKLSLNLNNGISLCIPCHKELHYGRGSDV